MATEYRLSYTGSEVNERLRAVSEIQNSLDKNYNTSTEIDDKIASAVSNVNTIINTAIEAKADLVDGKVPAEQLPLLAHPDYLQNDPSHPDYIHNRPFYDDTVQSVYVQVAGVPTSKFDLPAMGVSYLKFSDLTPSLTTIVNKTKLTIHGTSDFKVETVLMDTDGACVVIMDNGLPIVTVYAVGEYECQYMGIPLSFTASDTGMYTTGDLGATEFDEGEIFEVQVGNIKQIDPKFIPANLDFDLSDYYTKVEIDSIIGDCNSVLNEINALVGE